MDSRVLENMFYHHWGIVRCSKPPEKKNEKQSWNYIFFSVAGFQSILSQIGVQADLVDPDSPDRLGYLCEYSERSGMSH